MCTYTLETLEKENLSYQKSGRMYANVKTIVANLVHQRDTSTLCDITCCLRASMPLGLVSLSVPASPSAMIDWMNLKLLLKKN